MKFYCNLRKVKALCRCGRELAFTRMQVCSKCHSRPFLAQAGNVSIVRFANMNCWTLMGTTFNFCEGCGAAAPYLAQSLKNKKLQAKTKRQAAKAKIQAAMEAEAALIKDQEATSSIW